VEVPVKREKVTSSFIKAIGYDATEKLLEVEFKGRPTKVFEYYGVSGKKAQALVEAQSIGQYFNDKILGKFQDSQVQ
jgi:hypothetical protein